jgi:serine/threonine protein kinase
MDLDIPDPGDEVLGQRLEQHLEALRKGDHPEPADPELARLAPIVERLHQLSGQLTASTVAAAADPTGPPQTTAHYAPPVPPPQPGPVGKFQVVRPLGRGGQALTVLAFDPDLRRHVVLKLFHSATSTFEQEAVLGEGRALARVRSPYVAQVYSAERHDGLPYLVVEYIPGEDLAHRQRRQPFDIPAALELVGRLAKGLSAVHACGLLHRDIKPANVLIGEDGRPRLVDFGLASGIATGDPGSVAGTLAYMAPEQARGEIERIDARSDLFGLGAVLYELLTGAPPYRAATQAELWDAARAGEIEPVQQRRPGLPAFVGELCQCCLAKDPSGRFASAAELAGAIRRYQRRPARRRALILAGATAALLLGAAVLWPFAFRQRPPDPAPTPGVKAPDDTPDNRPHQPKAPVLRRDFPLAVALVGARFDRARKLHTLANGQTLHFRIKVGRACRVGIWNTLASGKIIQLFPNDRDPDNALRPGQIHHWPRVAGQSIRARTSTAKEIVHIVASTAPWPAVRGRKVGPFDVFASAEEQANLRGMLRELELVDDQRAVAEEVLSLQVLPR